MKQISILRWVAVYFLVAFSLNGCICYKALFVLLFPSKSIFITASALAEEMVHRGHDVTVVSCYPKDNASYQQIIMDIKPFELHFKSLNRTQWQQKNPFLAAAIRWKSMHFILETALQSKEMRSVIHSEEHYDVILGAVSFYQPIITALGHKFNAPVIDIVPSAPLIFTAGMTGNPHAFSYAPNRLLPFGDQMTFFERAYNAIFNVWLLAGEYLYLLPAEEALMRKYFTYPGAQNLPPLREMIRNVSISLINAHFSLNYPRPCSPNMIEVGGMHLKPVKKRPQDLQKFMDEAEHGVVYFSLGTVVKDYVISAERLQKLILALTRLEQRVIFKWNDPAPFQGAKNILVLSYAPQQEILAHPNCVLFVTHGGYNSLIEVVRAGVPILGIPISADQFHNIRYLEDAGVGKGIDIEHFNSDEMHATMTNIIETPSQKAREISRRTQDRPQSPMDTAIFWVEYVVRHKGAHHLKPAAVYLSYYQYLLLDVLGAMLLVIFIVYKIIATLCYSEFRLKTRNFFWRGTAFRAVSKIFRGITRLFGEKHQCGSKYGNGKNN